MGCIVLKKEKIKQELYQYTLLVKEVEFVLKTEVASNATIQEHLTKNKCVPVRVALSALRFLFTKSGVTNKDSILYDLILETFPRKCKKDTV